MDVALANGYDARLKPFVDKVTSMEARSLAMHVYHSYQSVLACQEAMWEELKDWVLNKKSGLKAFGWDDDEELSELQSRSKFDLLIGRFKQSASLFMLSRLRTDFTAVICTLGSACGHP
jgi:hypothetical protein